MGENLHPSIGILVRFEAEPTALPCDRPSTHIIARWAHQNVPVLYIRPDHIFVQKGCIWGKGWLPDLHSNTWIEQERPLLGLYNRYPMQHDPQTVKRIVQWSSTYALPYVNHPSFQQRVLDKKKTGELLHSAQLPTPPIYTMEEWIQHLQSTSNIYFLKPRFGAFGAGIYTVETCSKKDFTWLNTSTQVSRTNSLKELIQSYLKITQNEEYIIQQGIPSPAQHLKGMSIRSLIQLTKLNTWKAHARVARISYQDPVANVARGAEALPLEDLCKELWNNETILQIERTLDDLDHQVGQIMTKDLLSTSSTHVVEMGIDYILDPKGKIWILEVNGFPQGKLYQLTQKYPGRFQQEYTSIQTRPLEYLCQLTSN